jgi:hypothetical protein
MVTWVTASVVTALQGISLSPYRITHL